MYGQYRVAAVLVAGGSSTRMGFDKLLHKIQGVEVVRLAALLFAQHAYVDEIVLVAGESNLPAMEKLFEQYPLPKPLVIVQGGSSRMASVYRGVQACGPGTGLVAIHDAARPFATAGLVARTIEAAAQTGGAAPALPVTDTIKRVDEDGTILRTPPRSSLRAVQTPQVFLWQLYREAMEAVPLPDYPDITDDCMVMERFGRPVRLVEGEHTNGKITIPQDLTEGSEPCMQMPRIGHGYDVHRLVENRPLVLGGVAIPYEKGLLGHSDADVLLHAVSDALLGAAALGDIGAHFPDTDPAYKNADSLVLLQRVANLLHQSGYRVGNVDATLLCQAPKLAPHIPQMRQNIARALGVGEEKVSVKATTEEGLGFTGTGQGIAAHCVVLVQGPQAG